MGEHRRSRAASDYATEQTEQYRKIQRGQRYVQKLIRRRVKIGYVGRLSTDQYLAAHAAYLRKLGVH